MEASLGVDPRTCRSKGAAIYLYVLSLVPTHRRSRSKGIACVLVFSVMPLHPRGHMSF